VDILNRAESKYFNTAVRMDEAFLDLLETKDLPYITVKEICEKAGVNRSTFYLHYETVGDLLEESTRYVLAQFLAYMPHEPVGMVERIQYGPLDELYLVTPAYLVPYLRYIREHKRLFRTAVEHAETLGMDSAYKELSQHILLPIFERFQVPPENRDYLMAFYIQGLMAIIRVWLQHDCTDSIEHITAIMQQCVMPPLHPSINQR